MHIKADLFFKKRKSNKASNGLVKSISIGNMMNMEKYFDNIFIMNIRTTLLFAPVLFANP